MNDEPKTKAQLVRELRILRARVKKIEKCEEKQRHLVGKLRENEFKFRSIVKQSADGIVVADEQGSIIEWNPAYERLTGLKRAEVLRKPVWEVIFQTNVEEQKTPAVLDRFRVSTLDFLKTGRAPWLNRMQERDIQCPDGMRRSVQAVMFPIKTDKGFQSVSITRDVTERKHAEEQLAYQARLLTEVSDAIVASDENYKLTVWNARAEKMYGWKAKEVLGWNGLEIVRTEWPGVDADEMRRAIAETGHWRGEATQARKDGTRIPVEVAALVLHDENGRITGYVSVNRDITERKRMDEELRHSLAWQEAIFEGSLDAVFIADSQDRFVAVNIAACDLTGYTREELLKMQISDLHEEEVRAAYNEFRDRIMTGEPILSEARIRRKDGIKIHTEFNNSRVIIAGIPYMHTTARDITERKRAEESVQESEERFRMVFENVFDGISIYSEDLDPSKRRLVECNERYAAMAGRSRGELLQLGSTQELQKTLEDTANINRLESLTRGAAYQGSFSWIRPDEKDNIVEYVGMPITWRGKSYSIGIDRDITERKRVEVALLASETRYRSYIDATGQIGWVTNADGEVVEDVPSLRKFSGQTYEEAKGLGWAKALHPDDLERTLQVWHKAVTAKSSYEIEYRIRRHDGVYRYFLTRSFPLSREDGSIREWVGTCIDITERKKSEWELRSSHAQLHALAAHLQSVREDERTNLARELHDELGQLLTGLKMELSFLDKTPTNLDSIRPQDLRNAKVDSMNELIDKAIEAVRGISLELRPAILDSLGLSAALEWLANDFQQKSGIDCSCSIKTNAVFDSQCSTAMFRITQEALTNILRHSEAKKASITFASEPNEVILSVCDNGIGMEAKQIGDVRSLGLLGIRERAAAIGGTIEIDSKVGKGTTVLLRIPSLK